MSTPISPRAVVATAETTTSWLVRSPPLPTAPSALVRASRPLADISAKQGSSATSSATAVAVTAVPADSSRTVRRGVP